MGKRSVYIPDKLWDEVRAACGRTDVNFSELVQLALRRAFLATSAVDAPLHRPTVDAEVVTRLRGRFRQEAQASYDDGCRAGVLLAESLSWDELLALEAARMRFPIDGDDSAPLTRKVRKAFADAWGPDWREVVRRDPQRLRGARHTLHAIWRSVSSDVEPGAAPEDDDPATAESL